MADVGGNMMASPVVLAILQALFAALPWNPTSGAVRADTSDVDAAMTAFHNCVTPEAQEHTRGISWDSGQQKKRRMKTKQNLNLTRFPLASGPMASGLVPSGLWPSSSIAERPPSLGDKD